MSIVRQLVRSGVYYGLYEVLWRGEKSRAGLRRVMMGGVLLFMAVPVAFVGVLVGVAALFFGLAEVEALVQPALITAGVVWLIAALLFYQGWRNLRR